MNDFIIEINLSKSSRIKLLRKREFILILDTSGSMKKNIPYPVSTVIIKEFNKLGYQEKDSIHLITFYNKNKEKSKEIPVKDLQKERVGGYPDTYMAGVCWKIKSILEKNKHNKNFRVLILSDGKIYDQEETKYEIEKLKKYIDENNYIISVGSLRYNTDPLKYPDTRAISSFLILDSYFSKPRILTEVSCGDSNIKVLEKSRV